MSLRFFDTSQGRQQIAIKSYMLLEETKGRQKLGSSGYCWPGGKASKGRWTEMSHKSVFTHKIGLIGGLR